MQNCPNVLDHGTCSVQRCPLLHNILNCEPCGRIFKSRHAFDQHMKSGVHKRRVAGQGVVLSCPLCLINVDNGRKGWEFHLRTRRHHSALQRAGLTETDAVEPQEGLSQGHIQYCNVCRTSVMLNTWQLHVRTSKHLSREAFVRYKSVLGEAEKDKNGIVIGDNVDFGYVDPQSPHFQQDRHRAVEIRSTELSCRSTLLKATLATSQGSSRIKSAYVSLHGL